MLGATTGVDGYNVGQGAVRSREREQKKLEEQRALAEANRIAGIKAEETDILNQLTKKMQSGFVPNTQVGVDISTTDGMYQAVDNDLYTRLLDVRRRLNPQQQTQTAQQGGGANGFL